MTLRSLFLCVLVTAFAAAPVNAQDTAKPASDGTPAASTDALRKRIDRLDERLGDMNAMIGTLESLARQRPGSPPLAPGALPPISPEDLARQRTSIGEGGEGFSALADRIDGMETQIQALAGQLEHLTLQLNDVQARLGSAATNTILPSENLNPEIRPEIRSEIRPQIRKERGARPRDQAGRSTIIGEVNPEREGAGLGSVAIAPAGPGERKIPGSPLPSSRKQSPRPQFSTPIAPASPPRRQAELTGPIAKSLYEEAYGHLLRRDYGAAEVGFRKFLRQYPKDNLSGNAQFWLGESYYVRGQYRQAADNFLKGYTKYKGNLKASESLLKLAMSLKKLGQSGAACATFEELKSTFPSAPGHVKRKAKVERQRAGC